MKTVFSLLAVFLFTLVGGQAQSQEKVYLTNVASKKAEKIYFEVYSSDTENWIHFTDSPHRAEIKVHIKSSCVRADIEVVDHIDNNAKWLMITKRPTEADKRIYLSSYFNKDAKLVHLTDNPYGADIVICMDKDHVLRNLDSRDRAEELKKIVAALLFTKLFEPKPEISQKTVKKIEFIHDDLELIGSEINRMRESLAPAIVFDSVSVNIDRLERVIRLSQKVSYAIDSANQMIKNVRSALSEKCPATSSLMNQVESDNEVSILDLRDAERRLELAIEYNSSDEVVEDLKKALNYFDEALKRTIASISRMETIHQEVLNCL